MKAVLWKALACGLLAASAAAAQTPHTVINPDWLRRPTAQELTAVWPAEATKQGLTQGRAIISCSVMLDGKLANCVVKEETPPGAGLGAAALKLSETMLMRPQMVDGKAVQGANVTIPVNFQRLAAPPPAAFDTPPDWLRKPTYDQMMAVYPRAAGQKGADGRAVIKCTVNLEGLLRDCTVAEETPAGLGFGPAAIVLAPTFLMKPAMRNGQPVEASVTVPINFKSNGAFTPSNSEPVTIVSQTIWARTPKTAEILALIDKKVGDKFADGKVVFQCDLNSRTGHMSGCEVANASPGMAQFTGVARALVPKFEVSPEALAQYKGKVKINIAFAFPDMASPTWSKRYLTHPRWIKTITPDPNKAPFPEDAIKAGLKTGAATVDCVVAPDGALTRCEVVSESTPGVGFGTMAQQIAEAFVANPWNEDGLPVDGAHVKMPIRMDYEPPADAPSASPATAPTPATRP
jgi:TonB family protein